MKKEDVIKIDWNNAKKYLDIAGVILVAIDANQNVTFINKKGCEILGYEKEEIVGKNWFTIRPFDLFQKICINPLYKKHYGLRRGETNECS